MESFSVILLCKYKRYSTCLTVINTFIYYESFWFLLSYHHCSYYLSTQICHGKYLNQSKLEKLRLLWHLTFFSQYYFIVFLFLNFWLMRFNSCSYDGSFYFYTNLLHLQTYKYLSCYILLMDQIPEIIPEVLSNMCVVILC